MAGLAISIAAAVTATAVENRRGSIDVAQSVERRLAALTAGINEIVVTVSALAAHVASDNRFNRASVMRFLEEMPVPDAVETLSFAAYVAAGERATYEDTLATRGIDGGLRDLNPSQGLVPAAERPFHIVVALTGQPERAQFPEGVDLMSDGVSREAILFAAEENEVAASAALPVQAPDDAVRFEVFAPAYRSRQKGGTDDLIGMAAAQVNLDLLLARTFTANTQIAEIVDLSADGGPIYARDVDLPLAVDNVHRTFSAANRTWQVTFASVAGRGTILAPLVAFVGGALLTLLAIALVERWHLRRQARQTDADFAAALERLGVSEESYDALFGNLAVGVSQAEVETGTFVAVNDRFCEMLGYAREELLQMTAAAVEHQGRAGAPSRPAATATTGTARGAHEERFRRKDGSVFWGLASVSETPTTPGHAPIVTTVVQDITAAKEAEASLRTLVRELAHRVRNTTQLISSLAEQTRQQAASVDDYHARFVGRLHALSSAQDALFERSWSHVDAGDVMRRALLPFTAREAGRLIAEIDRIEVSAQEAQTLALTMHELGANATRHGAWSVPEGRVHLNVRRLPPESDEAECMLDIAWTERNGPAVDQPAHRGFGSTMLTRLLPAQHAGRSELSYDPEGFRFRAHLAVRRRAEDGQHVDRAALMRLASPPQ